MATDNNEPAKLLLPYLQRADELQKHEPLVAYYCRLYAMERGLKIPQNERTKTTNSLLVSLMKQLEKDKKSITLGPEDSLYLEGFASNVFAKADKQDRAGRADLNTAKTFYAASIFFEILNQFGELQPDLEQKQKYAAWKAVDIRKALKEGRRPVPGNPTDDTDLSLPSSSQSNAQDFTTSDSAPVATSRMEPNLPTPSPQPPSHDNFNSQPFAHAPPPQVPGTNNGNQIPFSPPLSSYPSNSYPTHDPHSPPHTSRSENRTYSQVFHQPQPQDPQPHFPQESHNHFPQESHSHFSQEAHSHFSQESQPHLPQDSQPHFPQYRPHETPSPHNYPNFQTYPSISDSSLPEVPSHYPTYHQSPDASYSPQAPPANFRGSVPQYNSGSISNSVVEPVPPPAPAFHYDCNYQPPPEKIAEAHKAARFAVGALAFDDVPVAVEFLRKSYELLTNPSAGN